ncbi:putative acetylcholinesterase [Aspergillus bombycis]|uniref:Putative acetylcholinesterase n=1 Tax=Aspergillus bombycis TaxID=109264 RepID=A0A1F8A0T7_9EURO|nr:putative acetylcholinesterase [Aspergillus bombycis]OGM45334.1 putative acetylcholinesterase [Aspergillus bombycis]
MSFRSPISKCSTILPSLGRLEGFQYANGVQQYCGIPYASLKKRWTRSQLMMQWPNNYHDGAKLGSDCPRPKVEGDDSDDLVPVPPTAHFGEPRTDELSGLVMNIVLPCAPGSQRFPVMVYVHGGSLLYGGANLPIFDGVNLVSLSMEVGMPIVYVNFNYRVGLGGFLAGAAIQQELQQDGYQGCGNFGFTDQQVAFEWVQRYIGDLGGNSDRVTAVGESAGGISISNQMLAAHPPSFRRAVCMSGLSVSIPAWSIEQHEQLFRAVCRHFDIDPAQLDVLDCLRRIPQQELANATPIIQGVLSGTGNPCLDGWFHDRDPLEIHEPPQWIEALIFASIREILSQHMPLDETDKVLAEYEIQPELPKDVLLSRVEHMCGDAIFKIPNYATVLASTPLTQEKDVFAYHFDQRSRLRNALEGTAYHAYELLYLFGNLDNELSNEERVMARDFAEAWVRFTYGYSPWESSERHWKVWGPESIQAVKSEEDDEEARSYSRMKRLLAMDNGETWRRWLNGVDALVNKRMNMGKNYSS